MCIRDRFKAGVVDRRVLRKGDTTGYASICRMKRDTDAAVVAIGHHNGFGLVKRPDRCRPLDPVSYTHLASTRDMAAVRNAG